MRVAAYSQESKHKFKGISCCIQTIWQGNERVQYQFVLKPVVVDYNPNDGYYMNQSLKLYFELAG